MSHESANDSDFAQLKEFDHSWLGERTWILTCVLSVVIY